MLWYKAWLESRSRFLISLVGATGFCANVVFNMDGNSPFHTASDYRRVLASGHVILSMMWIMAVTLLMMGGLLREKAHGSSSFTLALPVSRMRLMGVRVGVGALEAIALGVIPWGAMFLIGSSLGKTNSVSQVIFFIVLLVGGGSLFLGLGFLISSLIEGEYTAPILSFGIAITLLLSFDGETLRPYDPWRFITGLNYLNPGTALLTGPIPWLHVGVTLLIAGTLIAIAVKAMSRWEF